MASYFTRTSLVSEEAMDLSIEEQGMQVPEDIIDRHIDEAAEELIRIDHEQGFRVQDTAAATQLMLDNDEQTHHYQNFVAIATNFSSIPMAERLQRIPEMVQSLKTLLENMMKEIKEYKAIAEELQALIDCFVRLVMETKHVARKMLPLLESAANQLRILEDVIGTEPAQPLNDTDRTDIKWALNHMFEGMNQFLELAKSTKNQSRHIGKNIETMTKTVGDKKLVVEERRKIAKYFFQSSIPIGTGGTMAIANVCVTSSRFGGLGALAVGSLALPPVQAIVGASIFGLVGTAAIATLVKKFWVDKQVVALQYLEEIMKKLIELRAANTNFLNCMDDADEKVHAASRHMRDVQLCLESERQRRINRHVSSNAVESTNAVIESLRAISFIDLSLWVDATNALISPHSTTNAIEPIWIKVTTKNDDKQRNVYIVNHVDDFHLDVLRCNLPDRTNRIHSDIECKSYDHNPPLSR